ncbi:MAG: tRNA 2-thiouridine(34) synthase MnmA [Armatimonadota bacterium]|nr:tRNA 2-thiouridine(34) synthase MnmA [Armatimonadota bacterium]
MTKVLTGGTQGRRVAVAMSGGVDSSVAAALLVEQGYEVIGMTMNLWPSWLPQEEGATRTCCGLSAIEDARAVCRKLGIRHYVLNMREAFQEGVIEPFSREYIRGRTPNPCILCNRVIKFEVLLSKVRGLGMDFLATGHYARVTYDGKRGRYLLLRGKDRQKDQSYVLFGLTQDQLPYVLFPLGEWTKEEVRAYARRLGLPVADKPDSQEICFVPRGNYTEVIRLLHPEGMKPGPILDLEGREIGQHQGIARYTVGQRRGLGLAMGKPMYVVEVDPERNAVIVGPEEALTRETILAEEVNWIAIDALVEEMEVTARIRHAGQEVPARLVPIPGREDRVLVRFSTPVRAPTPGQAIVFYDGEVIVGGGTISRLPDRLCAILHGPSARREESLSTSARAT